jgi:hypothetical protein
MRILRDFSISVTVVRPGCCPTMLAATRDNAVTARNADEAEPTGDYGALPAR